MAGHRYSNPFSMIVKKSRTFFLHRVKKEPCRWYCRMVLTLLLMGFRSGTTTTPPSWYLCHQDECYFWKRLRQRRRRLHRGGAINNCQVCVGLFVVVSFFFLGGNLPSGVVLPTINQCGFNGVEKLGMWK